MNLEDKAKLIYELSYLYSEFGHILDEDEATLIKSAVDISTIEGVEYVDDYYWSDLIKIFKKYDNEDLSHIEEVFISEEMN